MKKVILLAVLLATAVPATPLIGRSAAVSKPFKGFAWVNAGYNRQARVYDWLFEKDYVALAEDLQVTTYGADLLLGLGLPLGFELDAVAPLWVKTRGDAKSTGIGDMTLMLRNCLPLPEAVPFQTTLALGMLAPTSDENSVPALDDGTLDIGIAASILTDRFGPFTGHLRAGYWFSGEYEPPEIDATKPGNLFEYIAVLDWNATASFVPEVALSGSARDQTEIGGFAVPTTESSSHYASLLLLTKPLPFLVVRPKVGLPLEFISKGGALPAFTLGLDVWASFP